MQGTNMKAGLDAGPVQPGTVPAGDLFRLFNMGENGDTQFARFALATFVCGRDNLRLAAAATAVVRCAGGRS